MILADGMMRGLSGLSGGEQAAVWIVLFLAFVALGYAGFLRAQVLAYDTGNDRMRQVWGWIRDGANAYLGRQFRTIVIAIIILCILMFYSVKLIPPSESAKAVWGSDEAAKTAVAIGRALSFLMGSMFSYAVGFVGMNVAVIADLVGDNVGDCAGMAADVFESFEVTMVAAMILGIVLGTYEDANHVLHFNPYYLIFPLLARGIGVIASIIGTYVVKTTEQERNAMRAMNRGFW